MSFTVQLESYPQHTAKATVGWFALYCICVLERLSQIPDRNPTQILTKTTNIFKHCIVLNPLQNYDLICLWLLIISQYIKYI